MLPSTDATRRHRHHLAASRTPKTAIPVLQTVPITPTGVNLSRASRVPPRTPGTNHSKQYESAPTSPNSSADNTHEARNNTQLPQHHSKDPLRTQQTFPQCGFATIHPHVFSQKTRSPLPSPTLSTMSTQLPHVTLSYRGSSSRSSHLKGQLRLHRGAYVRLSFDLSQAKPWEIWESIALARIIASVQQRDPTPLVVGSSALLLHGVRGWIANPNVELYQPKRRTSQLIPPCRCGTVSVPAAMRVYRRTPPITSERTRVSGIVTEHPYDALIRCAMHDDALQAFALGCRALRKWSNFSNFSQDLCRGRAEDIRKEILSRLERAKGHRGYARARRILSTIDPGCSNPAEAALAWVVRSLCPYEVSTQYELLAGGRPLFTDIAIPMCKLIIEFDGIEKLGSTQGEFDRAKRSWVQREQALQDQGWHFLRVHWQDFNDWNELRRRISSAIGVASKPIPTRYALLWEPPSERCDGEGRRFRGHEWHESGESWT